MSEETPPAEPAQGRVAILARALVVAGGALLAYGAGTAWRPAGFMVAGLLLLVVGVGALRE